VKPDRDWMSGSPFALGDEGLHQMVARIARSRPSATAVRSGNTAVTYAELDQTADEWASLLSGAGIGPAHVVPIVLPRSTRLITALLAMLKTGAAYSLLDPSWPRDRLVDMIRRLDAPLVVAEPGSIDGSIDAQWTPHSFAVPSSAVPSFAVRSAGAFRPVAVDGSHPCCVFWTSGTTGTPKGVLTPHRATARLFQPGTFASFNADTVIPLAAPVPWDAFSLELWSALLSGGTSVLLDDPYIAAQSLRDLVADHGISTVWLTSSLFNMVVDEDIDAFRGVSEVMIGGERLSPVHVHRFLRAHPAIALINGYGPVETTVFATTHRISAADCDRDDGIPLGRPVPGTRVFVLDGTRVCEVGEIGEICVAGDGLAIRYLGDPELTAAKFPDVELDGERLRIYRTADLGMWGEDGLLRFRGRADRQLKIRGHRVEPAEVERQVQRLLPSVRACRVLARRDALGAADRLVAFCVPRRPGDPLENALPALRSGLVAHHRPVAVVSVDSLPLTEQGKLDERTLLALLPDTDPAVSTDGCGTSRPAAVCGTSGPAAGSRNELVRLVAGTFAQVLDRASMPPDVSFFEAGGSSLGAGRVCARLAARLRRRVPISWFYEHPTAGDLAGQLSSAPLEGAPAVSGGGLVSGCGSVPLTPMQLVFLMRHLADPSDLTSHCVLTWEIRGDLDRVALQSAVSAVHRRHEPLRAAYAPDPAPAVRLVDVPPPDVAMLPAQPSTDLAVRTLRRELASELWPVDGIVWRAALVPVEDGQRTLFGVVLHHIAFDGWSESVLARDLTTAYNMARDTGRAALPAAPSLSAAYDVGAHYDKVAVRHAHLIDELAGIPDLRWHGTASGGPPGHLEYTLGPEVVAGIESFAGASGVRPFVVLLSAWGRSLAEATGQDDFAVGVPVARRETALLDEALGCHITMLCIRLRGTALSVGSTGVREAGRTVARALAAQDVSLTDLFRRTRRPGNARPPLFQTLFALQDNTPPRLDLTGLRTRFIRQPYLDLPLELHAELWPEDTGELRLVVSFRRDAVPDVVAGECADRLSGHLSALASEGASL